MDLEQRIILLRVIGFIMLLGGPYIARYFDETNENQRIIKMFFMFLCPCGFFTIMVSVLYV